MLKHMQIVPIKCTHIFNFIYLFFFWITNKFKVWVHFARHPLSIMKIKLHLWQCAWWGKCLQQPTEDYRPCLEKSLPLVTCLSCPQICLALLWLPNFIHTHSLPKILFSFVPMFVIMPCFFPWFSCFPSQVPSSHLLY